MHLGLKRGPLCPVPWYYVKGALLLYQSFTILRFVTSSGSKKKEPRYACLSEAKASHSHRTWTEVFSSVPRFLQMGLLLNPITYICLLRVLCPVRREVMTLDFVPLKESNRAFVAGLGPEIIFRACLWVLQGPHHIAKCWLSMQRLILLIFCLETPRDGSGHINFWVEPPLAGLSAISFPHTPACPRTQYSPTVCWVDYALITLVITITWLI